MKYLTLFTIALISFIIIDSVWLGLVSNKKYKKEIGNLLAKKINWFAVIMFYLLFSVGLVFFVISPSVEKESIKFLLISGVLFRLITYSTYDLTNLVTLKNRPINITIINLLCCSFISTTVSYITYNLYMIIR